MADGGEEPNPAAGFEAHLRLGEESFGEDDAALLRAIEEHRSLNAAAGALGRSYSRAHARIATLEESVGSLVERRRGGRGGGGSRLTSRARTLLDRFERLQVALSGTAQTEEVVLDGTVLEREGELATIETGAGQVRALLFEPAERVQVSFRGDAVTLHAPGSAPAASDTSARNRFVGEVVGVDRREAIVRVAVDVGIAEPVVALVTVDSLERLALEPGAEIVASFKATATRATPVTATE